MHTRSACTRVHTHTHTHTYNWSVTLHMHTHTYPHSKNTHTHTHTHTHSTNTQVHTRVMYLTQVIREATAWKAPPTQRKGLRKGRIYYATQAAMRPPTFVFFVNAPSLISDDYRRYVERALRDNIGLSGTPLRYIHAYTHTDTHTHTFTHTHAHTLAPMHGLLWRGKPERHMHTHSHTHTHIRSTHAQAVVAG